MEQHSLCEGIMHINEHIKEIVKMYADEQIGIDALVADMKYLSETICEAGEAREHVKDAHDYMKTKVGNPVPHTMATAVPRRGVSVNVK